MKHLLLPLLLAISAPCLGQSDFIKSDLIQAPDTVPVGSTIVVQIKGDLPYTIEPKPTGLIRLKDDDGNRVLLIQGAVSPGYEISVDYQVIHPTPEERKAAPWDDRVKFDKWLEDNSRDEFYQDSHTVKVGKQPDPGPDPDPEPDPDNKPPFPADGLHVLIVFESVDANKLTSDQRLILYGADVRDFLNTKCAMGPDGKTRAFRIYDADSDVSGDQEVWKAAMGVERKSLPWLVVSNGKAGFSGPLNMSPEKFKEIIQGYAK